MHKFEAKKLYDMWKGFRLVAVLSMSSIVAKSVYVHISGLKVDSMILAVDGSLLYYSFPLSGNHEQLYIGGLELLGLEHPNPSAITIGLIRGSGIVSWRVKDTPNINRYIVPGSIERDYKEWRMLKKRLEELEREAKVLEEEGKILEASRELPDGWNLSEWLKLHRLHMQRIYREKARIARLKDSLSRLLSYYEQKLKPFKLAPTGKMLVIDVSLESTDTLIIALSTGRVFWHPAYRLDAKFEDMHVTLELNAKIENMIPLDIDVTKSYITTLKVRDILTLPKLLPIYLDAPKFKPRTSRKFYAVAVPVEEAEQEELTRWGMTWEVKAMRLIAMQPSTIKLNSWEVDNKWEWLIYPELHRNAFVTVRWSVPAPLPPGTAYLYLDGHQQGTTYLTFDTDSITVVLGMDKMVYVKREVIEYKNGSSLTGRETAIRKFRVVILNRHNGDIYGRVVVRVPVSRREEIKVEFYAEPPYDRFAAEKGFLEWNRNFPQGSTTLEYGYEVTFPARWDISVP